MKSGTTTLFRDLGMNPEVFVPDDKEPNSLSSDEVFTDSGRKAYLTLFARAKEGQVCGEASTSYTKRPRYEGAASRAHRILGEKVRIIYIVRDPIDRIVSHHYHEYFKGRASADINTEVMRNTDYVNYSMYMKQIQPWIDHFSDHQVRVVRFEDYVTERRKFVSELSNFIGVTDRSYLIDEQKNYNRSDFQPVVNGVWRRIYRNPFYRKGLRRIISWRLRSRIRHIILPRAAQRPLGLSEEIATELTQRLNDDVLALSRYLGTMGALWPRWDFRRINRECRLHTSGKV